MLSRTNTGELSSPRLPLPPKAPWWRDDLREWYMLQYLPWRSQAESISLPVQRPHSSCRECSAGAALQLTPLQAVYRI